MTIDKKVHVYYSLSSKQAAQLYNNSLGTLTKSRTHR